MYSPDRFQALKQTIYFLEKMPEYSKCQKTLLVDGNNNFLDENWHILQVPRINNKFSWRNMWEAGVNTARNEKVIYLDSDRLLPSMFLTEMNDKIKDDLFVFTSLHFMLQEEIDRTTAERLFDYFFNDNIDNQEFIQYARYEPRYKKPVHTSGKNVMSGSVGFTKKTYHRIGGVDPWYTGHGAFADTDFHFSACVNECRFIDLQLPELHYLHPKLEGDKSLGTMALRRLGLDNYIYYCNKWKLPINLAIDMAHSCNLRYPREYVFKRLEEQAHL